MWPLRHFAVTTLVMNPKTALPVIEIASAPAVTASVPMANIAEIAPQTVTVNSWQQRHLWVGTHGTNLPVILMKT